MNAVLQDAREEVMAPRFELHVPRETSLRLATKCRYCGLDGDVIKCHTCEREIAHSKDSFSVGHDCFHCNVDWGKGD